MAIQRYKPEQIVTLLRQIEVSIGNGQVIVPSQAGLTRLFSLRLMVLNLT